MVSQLPRPEPSHFCKSPSQRPSVACRGACTHDRSHPHGPRPLQPVPRGRRGAGRPMLGHLDPEFLALLDETCDGSAQVFRTANPLTLPISGTGSAGMEAAFVNVVAPRRRRRRRRQRRVRRAHVRRRRALRRRGRARSSASGARRSTPSAARRAPVARRSSPSCTPRRRPACATTSRRSGAGKGDALLLVDCVTSLGGIPVEIDDWGVDIAYSGTQKCLGVAARPRAVHRSASARCERLVERPQSWYLDLDMIGGYVGRRRRRAPTTTPRRSR